MTVDIDDIPMNEDVNMADTDSDLDDKPALDDTVGEAVKVTKDGGVIKKTLVQGPGWERPSDGDEVQVNYIGRLVEEGVKELEGTEFDRNESRESPFTFTLGKGQVIRGWDCAVAAMKKGERALVTIKPEYGYGASGAGPKIPPNATLEFEIELLGWKNVNALTSDGKVVVKFIKQAPGGWQHPKDGWEATVNFKQIINGTVVRQEESFTLEVGSTDPSIPPFFNAAIKKFKKDTDSKGDLASLIIPSPHHPPVPGFPEDTTVTYEIEVLAWIEVEELEGSVGRAAVKRIIKEGSGWEKPKDGARVRAKLSGKIRETGVEFVSFTDDVELVLGENQLPEAVEVAMTTMKKGEVANVVASKDWGYGSAETKAKGLEGAQGFVFDIELVDFSKEPYERNKDEKIADSEHQKDIGNQYFKDGKLRVAIRKYNKALSHFQYDQALQGEEKKRVDAMKLSCHLNLAACFLKTEEYGKVVDHATKALGLSKTSVKALYRRAQAHLKRYELDEAKADVEKAMQVDQTDATLKSLARQIQVEVKKYEQKEKKIFQKMFR